MLRKRLPRSPRRPARSRSQSRSRLLPRSQPSQSPRHTRRTPSSSQQSGVAFVGLTGGLGAGKSTALAALERLGAAVLSTDAVVHELYATPAVRDAVRARLGDAAVVDGTVDRAAVARLVFADPAERTWLEGLLWPLVAQRVATFRRAASGREPRPAAIIIETPLLFEADMQGAYDATIAIVADDELRERRAAGRGHAEIAARERRQLGQDEKARRATYVVRNCGSLEGLERELAAILESLKR